MAIYENGNNGIGSIRFDDNTILEVKQPGGGGSGVGGAMGLNARNLITGEDTGEVIAAQNEQIAEQGEEIDTLTEQNTELQAENIRLQDANAELTERLAASPITQPLSIICTNNYTENLRLLYPPLDDPGVAYYDIPAGETRTVQTKIYRSRTASSVLLSLAKIINNAYSPVAAYGATFPILQISQPAGAPTIGIASSVFVIKELTDNDSHITITFTIQPR